MEGSIDIEGKGWDSVGWWIHNVTLMYDVHLGLLRSYFGKAISQPSFERTPVHQFNQSINQIRFC